MLRTELLARLDGLVPLALASSWDKSGIQVDSPRRDFTHMAVALDATPENVVRAAESGCDFLLTHHPLTLEPRFPDRLDTYHFVLSQLLTHGILHYAVHTCLDSMPQGPTVWLADALELKGRSVLEKSGILPDGTQAGIGCSGMLPAPIHGDAFLNFIKMFLSHPVSRIGDMPQIVRRVAICPGSGASLYEEALQSGADVYITGDYKYHAALDAANSVYAGTRMTVLDVGHFILEEEMMRRFAAGIAGLLPGMQVSFIPGNEPIIYEGVPNESIS